MVRRKHEPSANLGREPCAALAATACEDCAACTGRHALAEAMYLGAPTVVGLESPLHHDVLHSVGFGIVIMDRPNSYVTRKD